MDEIFKLGAYELAEKIRNRDLSSEEVVQAHIKKVQEVNPRLNAVCEDRFSLALSEARQVDRKLQSTPTADLPPYLGVPFTVKEMLSLKGFQRTAGNIHYKGKIESTNATVVERMMAAGAIPIATTNVPEMGFWFETNNVIYGRTNNPYDNSRTCGGSSGGEGALIGAGASPMGLGSDIGGSVRMPAFFCGVFGHKPTNRTLPLTGHFPFRDEDFKSTLRDPYYPFTTMGPLSRKARDLRLMTELLKGPDGIDHETIQRDLNKESSLDFKSLRVFVLADPIIHGTRRTDQELQQSTLNVAHLFEEMGAQVEELPQRIFLNAASLWLNAVRSTKQEHYFEILSNRSSDFSITKEFMRFAAGRPHYTFPSLVVSLGEFLGLSNSDTAPLLEELRQLREQLHKLLGNNGVLLMPPHSRVAPKHGAPIFSPLDFVYTGIFNILGLPTTSIPTGLSEDGLPLGVQIASNHFNDCLNFALAEALEEFFGGWVPL